MSLSRLSNAEKLSEDSGVVLVMVGSFAPVHVGHIDSIIAATETLRDNGEIVSAAVLTPNSDSYVSLKLDDKVGEWNFERRVLDFDKIDYPSTVPIFVDDLSGARPPERTITESAIQNIKKELGMKACQIIIVVGSDQAYSVRPHLKSNRAVCVIRPGNADTITHLKQSRWFRKAESKGQYIISDRANPDLCISSTKIRNNLMQVSIIGGFSND